jgi:hypothetical protein
MLVSIEAKYIGSSGCFAGTADTGLSQFELNADTIYPKLLISDIWDLRNFTYTKTGSLYQFNALVDNVVSSTLKPISCSALLGEMCSLGGTSGSVPTSCFFSVSFRVMISESVPVQFQPSITTGNISVSITLNIDPGCGVASCSPTIIYSSIPDSKKNNTLFNNCVTLEDFYYIINTQTDINLSTTLTFWTVVEWNNINYYMTCSATQYTLGQSFGCLLAPVFNYAFPGCSFSISLEVTNAQIKLPQSPSNPASNPPSEPSSASQINPTLLTLLLCFLSFLFSDKIWF